MTKKQSDGVNREILINTAGIIKSAPSADIFAKGAKNGEELVAARRPSREIAQWRDRNRT
jgi:hypothetical protein